MSATGKEGEGSPGGSRMRQQLHSSTPARMAAPGQIAKTPYSISSHHRDPARQLFPPGHSAIEGASPRALKFLGLKVPEAGAAGARAGAQGFRFQTLAIRRTGTSQFMYLFICEKDKGRRLPSTGSLPKGPQRLQMDGRNQELSPGRPRGTWVAAIQ